MELTAVSEVSSLNDPRPHYKADHVGSLLRPQELLDARSNPSLSRDQLREIEDRCILRALQRQKDLGFRIFSDGELRRSQFMGDFYDSVEGLDKDGSIARAWKGNSDRATGTGLLQLTGLVVDKIRQTRRLTGHEVDFLARHSPGAFKMTLPTANQFPAIAYRKGLSERAYPTYSDFLWDVVPIIRSEIQALVNEGVTYVQVDAPRYSYYVDPKWRNYITNEMGVSPDDALDEAIRVDNACLEGVRREGVTLAIHLCRGNSRSQWYAEGGYDPIAEKLFNALDADLFLLEYESDRAGTFEPLRFVPPNKGVVLGLVSSKVPQLESRDLLCRRIDEASRYVPLDNLALSPQCGFASTLEGNLLTENEQWQKLQLVADTARAIWNST
jgi:5-methyltetrahydropteroyltriglutamate--homocysteine methyltransferase